MLVELKLLCVFSLRGAILGSEFPGPFLKLRRWLFYLNLQSGLKYKKAVIRNLFHRWVIRSFLDKKKSPIE